MMQLLAIHPNQVWAQECLYGTHLRGWCARYTEESYRSLQDQAAASEIQLWIVWNVDKATSEAVVASKRTKGDDGRITCHITLCAGRGAKFWAHLVGTIEDYARKNGCYRVISAFRPGWERLLSGYRKTHIVMEKVLS